MWCHSLLTAPPLRVPRLGLPAPVPAQGPTSPAAPPPPSGRPGVGPLTPAPRQMLGPTWARSTPLLCPSSAVASAVTAAQAHRRPYIHLDGSGPKTYAQCPKPGGRSQPLKRRDPLVGANGGGTEGHWRPWSSGSRWCTCHPAFTTPPTNSGPPRSGHLQRAGTAEWAACWDGWWGKVATGVATWAAEGG